MAVVPTCNFHKQLSTKIKLRSFLNCGNPMSFYCITQRGTPPTEVVDRKNNHPHILMFIDGDEDIPCQFFIAVEQEITMECKDFVSALYYLISTHYVFNIAYNLTVKDVMHFIQSKFAKFEDKNFKKSAVYLSVESGIECYLD